MLNTLMYGTPFCIIIYMSVTSYKLFKMVQFFMAHLVFIFCAYSVLW